jgi:hypothetical protein
MADNGDDQQQQHNPGRDGGDVGNGEADGQSDDNNENNNRHRGARGRAPSPVWVRDDDGSMELVERTPANVILWDLDDPFPEEQDEEEDEKDYDGVGSVESDDDNNLVELSEPQEPGMAALYLADLMIRYRRYRLRDLTVSFGADVVTNWADYPNSIARFVVMIDAYSRIKTLHVTRGNFGRDPDDGPEDDDDDDDDDDDEGAQAGGGGGAADGEGDAIGVDLSRRVNDDCLEEFFGKVLCNHVSLEEITFSNSRIPVTHWKLFTENLLTSGFMLFRLELVSTPLTLEKCQLLKRMLRRKIRLFSLHLVDCGLGAEEWRTVCEGVAGGGGHVDTLHLVEEDAVVGPDTLLPLLRPPSALESLLVASSGWSDGAFEGFVQELRTNECLIELMLRSKNDDVFPGLHLVEDLLTTYNCTLKVIDLDPLDDASQARINALLERNTRVRALGKPDGQTTFERYHLSRASVWPRVLEEYGRLPTQLYRFVRHGNLEGFAYQVDDVSASASAGPRGRNGRRASFRSEATTTAASARPRDAKKKTKRRRKLFSK